MVLLIGAAADCQFTLRSADTGDISDQTSSYPVADQLIPVGFSFGDNTVVKNRHPKKSAKLNTKKRRKKNGAENAINIDDFIVLLRLER